MNGTTTTRGVFKAYVVFFLNNIFETKSISIIFNVPAKFGRDRSINGRGDVEQTDGQTDRQTDGRTNPNYSMIPLVLH